MRSLIFFLFTLVAIDVSAQNLKSGGVLKPEQANMDIRHYTVALDVDPQQKSINGYTEIDFNLIKPSNYLLFDFWHGLPISQLLINGKKENFEHTKDDYIKIHLANELPAGKVNVKVVYGGNPIHCRKTTMDRWFSI